MRIILAALFCSFSLAGCTTMSNADYTKTVKSWQGASSRELIASWGRPNQVMRAPHSNTYYVYSTESQMRLPYPDQPRGAMVINSQGTNSSLALGDNPAYAKVRCTTTFLLRNGVVIDGNFYGGDCVGNKNTGKVNPVLKRISEVHP